MYLDWDKKPNATYVIDIETDDLNATVIHVMCWVDAVTGEAGYCLGADACAQWFEERDKDDVYVGHNILGFDAPQLNKLCGTTLGSHNCIDTYILTTLYRPNNPGGHSLRNWGDIMGDLEGKLEFEDFSKFSEEMLVYCQKDVELTCRLFKKIIKTLISLDFTEQSCWIQHRIMEMLRQQEINGFYFNQMEAINLYRELSQQLEELQDAIRNTFPAERVLVATRNSKKKDGGPTAIYLKDRARYQIEWDDSDSGTYRAFEDVEFNLGSSKQRIDKLLSLGWEPEEFTDAGNPQPFTKGMLAPSLERFLEKNDIPEVRLIARWMVLSGRVSMINNWLENYNEKTHCIHGNLRVADTLRFKHSSPNTANIPAVRTNDEGPILAADGDYTYEARDLWTARPGRVLVGTDAAGLELRMLAHYLNRPEFTEQVVEGDPHQYNADLVGVTRVVAKTLIYSTLYGAQAPKIAKTLDVSVGEAASIRKRFLEMLGVDELLEQCFSEQRSRIVLVDGSRIVCPSPHAALNYKLQGGGARVMSLAAIMLDRSIRELEMDSLKVGDIHDEWQYDVAPEHAEEHARLAVLALEKAGRLLKMNVPITGESKIGETWAETH